ncbi:MmcQ/YjbR family DNA-binding protein [soil metagenome]
MDIESFRSYCLAKPGTSEDLPFGPDTLTIRVMGKIFAFAGLDSVPLSVSLKTDPELAIDLRERYDAIRGAYHLNKKHWSSVRMDGSVPMNVITTMIDASYALVVGGLKKSEREQLALIT